MDYYFGALKNSPLRTSDLMNLFRKSLRSIDCSKEVNSVNILSKTSNKSGAESQQVFRQFAWNLAGSLAKTGSGKALKNSAKKQVGAKSKTSKTRAKRAARK